jgi:hypothetical protein
VCCCADQNINAEAAAELAGNIDTFDKHAAEETRRYAMD